MNKQYYYKSRKNFISSTGIQFSYGDQIDETAYKMLPPEEQKSFNRLELKEIIPTMNRALTRKHDPAKKTDEFYKKVLDKTIESAHYRLMIYFAHSTMVFYRKSIIIHEKMTVDEFLEVNKAVCERVFKEGIEIFNYELSHMQMSKAAAVYITAKYSPQSVEDSEVYVIPT